MKGIVVGLVGLGVGLYVASALIPGAIVAITCSTSYAGAPTVVITLATTVVGIVAVAALIMFLLNRT